MWPGESTHREMELLVMAGIPNLDVIKACTHDSARVLRREAEFGSLQPGLSADIILVSGDPANKIEDSRNIEHVLMRANQVDRESLKLSLLATQTCLYISVPNCGFQVKAMLECPTNRYLPIGTLRSPGL